MFNPIRNYFSPKVIEPLPQPPDGYPIIMLGLWVSGKSSIILRMLLGDQENLITIPTRSIDYHTIRLPYSILNTKFIIGDYTGSPDMIRFWPRFLKHSMAAVLVIDPTQRGIEEFQEAKEGIYRAFQWQDCGNDNEIMCKILLVFCNKQDMETVMTVEEVKNRLELETDKTLKILGIRWHIRGCSAMTGEGIWEGMEWIETQLKGSPLAISS